MPCRAKITLDSAMALCQGQRARQEDCIATHFPTGGPLGFAVLADGMGGHAAGDMASKLAVSEVFAELTHWSADPSELEQKLREGKNRDARGLCADLLDALKSGTTPEQDNTALCVIKVLPYVQSNAQHCAASSPRRYAQPAARSPFWRQGAPAQVSAAPTPWRSFPDETCLDRAGGHSGKCSAIAHC